LKTIAQWMKIRPMGENSPNLVTLNEAESIEIPGNCSTPNRWQAFRLFEEK
jgi:hypothetical protein